MAGKNPVNFYKAIKRAFVKLLRFRVSNQPLTVVLMTIFLGLTFTLLNQVTGFRRCATVLAFGLLTLQTGCSREDSRLDRTLCDVHQHYWRLRSPGDG